MMKETLAEAIRKWMADVGVTQQEAALFLETTQPRVSLIKRGCLDSITIDALVTYCLRVGLTVTITVQ